MSRIRRRALEKKNQNESARQGKEVEGSKSNELDTEYDLCDYGFTRGEFFPLFLSSSSFFTCN